MTDRDPFLNRQLDEYRVEALLGRGGMARVYRGVDVKLGRYVAIKVIDTPYQNNADYLKRFQREAQVIAQLDHPNVVRLYRYGEQAGFLYMVMQYIRGADLHTILSGYRQSGERMTREEVLHVIGDVCQALDYIHGQGVVHRDVKPSNILLNLDGRAILSDFGLALLTEVGTLGEIFGSPQYIAPEQSLSSARAEARSDLYSVGVIVYEMLTGRLPFQGEDALDLAMQHVQQPPPPLRQFRPDISPQLEAVVMKALSKDPDERYASGAALFAALEQAWSPEPAPASEPASTLSHLTIPERVQRQVAAHPLPAAAPQAAGASPALDRPSAPAATPITAPEAKSKRTSLWIGLGLAGMVMLLLVCVGLISLLFAINRAANRADVLPAVTAPAAGSALPSGAEGEPAAVLRLVRSDERGLVLINDGTADLALDGLQLGNSPSKVYGSEWQVGRLAPGDCVAVWLQGSDPQLPASLSCSLRGERLERLGPQPFWTAAFNVYYQDAFVGDCPAGNSSCRIELP